jgi:hypothetical protein
VIRGFFSSAGSSFSEEKEPKRLFYAGAWALNAPTPQLVGWVSEA